jgi:two-component system, NarL family, nitrate/nitrite response regulator NarL
MLATPPPIRVLLITEHALIRAGLRLRLERQPGLTVVADTATDTEALAAAAREHPDMILLDVDRGGHSDFALLPELLVAAPETRVLILTDGRDPEVHQHAVRLGALGLVVKDSPPAELLRAMEKVALGEVWFGRRQLARVLRALRHRDAPKALPPAAVQIATLTPRQPVLTTSGEGSQLTRQASPRRTAIAEPGRDAAPDGWEAWGDSLPRLSVGAMHHSGGLTESPRSPE